MYEIILYDTSNFENFPIGGQLTSIRNFLKYIVCEKKDYVSKILLVGISNEKDKIGAISKIKVDGFEFDFLPVLYRDDNLSNVSKSLRVEYLKALFKKRKLIKSNKNVIHYIHTPEAYIQIKFLHPFAKIVVFSHGSFFNMLKGFRFYKNNKIVTFIFNRFLISLLKRSNLIFTLDNDSTTAYSKYTKRICQVNNSIIIPNDLKNKESHSPLRLIFIGRLSKVKNIEPIILAANNLNDFVVLTIVGDGEEHQYLQSLIKDNNIQNVKLIGAVEPSFIPSYLIDNDILIMNSILEGKPMTILEAMSYGLPIIATPVGGIKEMTNENIDTIYTNGSVDSICDAINKIKTNYNYYSNNALSNSKKYDYKKVNEVIFESILKIK